MKGHFNPERHFWFEAAVGIAFCGCGLVVPVYRCLYLGEVQLGSGIMMQPALLFEASGENEPMSLSPKP